MYEFILCKYNILVWIKALPKNQKKSLWILKIILQNSHFKLLHLSMKLEVLNSYYKFILLKYEKYSHNSYLYNILVWIKALPKHQKKVSLQTKFILQIHTFKVWILISKFIH